MLAGVGAGERGLPEGRGGGETCRYRWRLGINEQNSTPHQSLHQHSPCRSPATAHKLYFVWR